MSTVRTSHIGIVTDDQDPEQRGRIKVACASLVGIDASGEPLEYPGWIPPVFGWRSSSDGVTGDCGFFFVPRVGATVEIEFTESSSVDQSPGMASIVAPDPKYRGCLLNPGDDIGDDFRTNYPARYGWRGPNGAILMFDPTEGSEKITIQSHEIDGAYSFFAIDEKGTVTIATANGVLLVLNGETGAFTVLDANSNMITTASDGWSLISGQGPIAMAKGKSISLIAPGQVLVNASHAQVNAKSINLGENAVEEIIKGRTFQALFNAHTHATPVGPSGPPTPPLNGSELSTVTKSE